LYHHGRGAAKSVRRLHLIFGLTLILAPASSLTPFGTLAMLRAPLEQARNPMQRERIADDVYVFTSERYAQVTASVIATNAGAVLIDTLVFPEETREIKQFVETRLRSQVSTIIYTHYHADHTYGAHFFPEAQVVAHARCYDLLDTRGREARAKNASGELAHVALVLPTVVFNRGVLNLRIGGKSFQLWNTPGHSMDSTVILLREDRILFAGDTLMPVPYFVDGDYFAFVASLESLRGCNFENIVQGHGEVILKGEIEEKLGSDLAYMVAIRAAVENAMTQPDPETLLKSVGIERCGKSRILLAGQVNELHQVNLRTLLRQLAQSATV